MRQPRLRFIAWLTDPCVEASPEIRSALIDRLFGTLPIFLAATLNSLLVAAAIAVYMGSPIFTLLAVIEGTITAIRLPVMLSCRRAFDRGERGPIDAYVLLSLAWALATGTMALAAMAGGHWIAATLACISATGMVGGIAFRNFSSPRFVAAMITACFGPLAIGGIASGEPLLLVTAVQVPMYLIAMLIAAKRMNRIMVATMRAEQDNAHRARHDPLTGLMNRTGLVEAMEARPADEPLACFFIDLDGFKRVNDTLGHQAGDELLAMVAARLRDGAGEGVVLARLGGDEFLVIAPCTATEEARRRGEALTAAIAGTPYIVAEQGVLIGASVGASLRPMHGETLDDLLAEADAALYRVKAAGRSSCLVAGDLPEKDEAPSQPALLKVANL